MAGIPGKKNEKVSQSSRPLHNFDLSSHLKWGHQKHLRCVKSSQSATARSVTPISSIPNLQTNSPAHCSRRSRVTASPVSPPKIDKGKSAITSSSDGSTGEIDAVRQKLMSDLKVAMDKHFRLGLQEEKGKTEEMKPAEDPLPWNLRNRQAFGKTTNESGKDLWPVRRNDRGYRSLFASGRGEPSGGNDQHRSTFSVSLSKAEIEADFLVMTGAKPPRRPKKRPKPVQKQLDGLFPGAWLSEVTPERYRVPRAPESKEK